MIRWVLLVLVACGSSSPSVDAPPAPADVPVDAGKRPIDLGVTWTPVGYPVPTAANRMAFYASARDYGTTLALHRPWRANRASAGQADTFAASIVPEAAAAGVELMYGYGFEVTDTQGGSDLTSDSEPANNTWTNAESRSEFCAVGVAYATARHPRYMFLGNEMDAYYRDHRADWANWVSELRACRDAIRAASPGTLVFTTFQLELVKGRAIKTGRPHVPADWTPIADVENAVDGIGFTSYPYFEYETPADIPATYYSEITQHTQKPILFTELGWTASPAQPYTGSAAEQAAFIDRFFALTAGLDVRYAVYLAQNDFPTNLVGPTNAFYQIGLRDPDGVARPADAAWRAQVSAHR